MGFHTHTLDTDIEKDDFSDVPRIAGGKRARVINHRFRKEVIENCSEDAVVFIFLSGIHFPHKVSVQYGDLLAMLAVAVAVCVCVCVSSLD